MQTLIRSWLGVSAFVFTSALGAQATSKQPITHESMVLMKRVGAPSVSPDGKWTVFSVTEPSYDATLVVSDLWIVPTDGKAQPRRLTSTKAGESDVSWSPDSRRLAFSARRDGDEANQIYILDLAGGEARRVSNLSTGARTPRFSPDGSRLAYTSSVYPGAPDDEANRKAAKDERDRKYRVRAYESFPIRLWDRWIDDKQIHLIVQPVDSGARARDIMAGTQLVRTTGFGVPTADGSREDIDAAWSPDGGSLVFPATVGRTGAAYSEVPTHLYRIPASGGEPVKIAGASGEYGNPTFSPDGRTLFATFSPNNGK